MAGPSSQDVEYVPLMEESARNASNAHLDSYIEHKANPARSSSRLLAPLVFCAFLVSVISFLFSGIQLFSFQSSHAGPVLDNIAIKSLRRPSMYMGLDRVEQIKEDTAALKAAQAIIAGGHGDKPSAVSTTTSTTPLATFSGRPERIIRVNADHPESHYPHDEWVLLTEKDMVLLEFQQQIPSTNQCKLAASLPHRRDLQDKMLTIEGEEPSLEVRITSLVPSNLDDITWRTLPKDYHLLTTMQLDYGMNVSSPEFACTLGRPMILQLSCIGKGCRLEYKDGDGLPRLGLQLL